MDSSGGDGWPSDESRAATLFTRADMIRSPEQWRAFSLVYVKGVWFLKIDWCKRLLGILLLVVLTTGCLGGATTGSAWSGLSVEGDTVFFASSTGKVYALDAATGNLRWQFPQGEKEAVGAFYASPVLVGDTLLVGSVDKNLYALDSQNGATRWTFTTGDSIVSAVDVLENTVFLASSDRKLYALDLATGAKRWEFTTQNWMWAEPLATDGRVYAASMDHRVYCLDAASGAKIWEHPVGAAIPGGMTLEDGVLYLGALDSRVHALDATSGNELWAFAAGRWVWGEPAVADGKVYFGALDQKVYVVNAASGVLAQEPLPVDGAVRAGVVYADGIAYVVTDPGNVYALNAADAARLTPKWPPFQAGAGLLATPVVSGDTIYVATTKGQVIAINRNTGTQQWQFPSQ